ncbi:MAG: serine hydrolase domain-containing protein [Capsulimonadaceae bacterium]
MNHSPHSNWARADALLRSGLDEVFTHAVYAVAVRGETVATAAFGDATLETVFDLASLTKPLSTAVLLLQSVERGEVHLGETIESIFADEDTPHLDGIELRHLATHTAGLPAVPAWPAGLERVHVIRTLLGIVPENPPGERHRYSDTGYMLLGEVLARTLGQPLDTLFQDRIASPMGLSTLRYCPPEAWQARIAPTSTGLPAGIVHDPRARDLGGVAGHAGLFGAAGDVLRMLEAIRTGGPPLLSPASVARMVVSQIPVSVGGNSIGWFCHGNDYLPAGDLFSNRAFGHTGFTGVLALIDPEYDASIVLLTNRVIHSSQDSTRYLKLRRLWINAVAAEVSRA